MKSTFHRFIGIGLALLLTGCTFDDKRPIGQPTAMRSGESPLSTMCRIRGEFAKLRKPILENVVFHEETTMLKQVEFHLHRKRLDAYYEYRLTEAADEFIARHSRAELMASFLPLILHPTWGGEVAVMLMGIPTTSREDAHYHLARPSTLLAGTDYRSPMDVGLWGVRSAIALMNSLTTADSNRTMYDPRGPHAWQTRGINSSGTLDERLNQLVTPARYLSYPHHGLKDAERIQSTVEVGEWLSANQRPALRDDYRALIEQGGAAFAALGLLPRGLPAGIAIEAMGLEKFWPLLYDHPDQWVRHWNPTGNPKDLARHIAYAVDEYTFDYSRSYYRRLYELSLSVCPDGPALSDHVGDAREGAINRLLVFDPPDLDAIQQHLAAGIDPSRPDATGWPPICTVLVRSAWTGPDEVHETLGRLLIEAGADLSVRCATVGSVAAEAVRARNWPIVSMLNDAGQRLSEAEGHALSAGAAFSEAIVRPDPELTDELLSIGVHPDAARPDGSSALQYAIAVGDTVLATRLVGHGADPALQNYLLQIVSSDEARNDLLGLLVEAGAPLEQTDKKERRPLQLAAVAGRLGQTRMLLQAGADPNARHKTGDPLVVLLQHLFEPEQSFPLIDLLLLHGADPTVLDRWGDSALTLAAKKGDRRLAFRLKEAGEVFSQSELHESLARHVSGRNAAAVALLIELGADADALNAEGMSFIEEAARRDALEVVDVLLAAGASPHTFVPSGVALKVASDIGRAAWRYPASRSEPREPLPLVTAALLAGRMDMLTRLIEHGVDVNQKTRSGLTPLLVLSLAEPGTINIDEGLELLARHGADVNAADSDGYSALTRAAEANRPWVLATFARAGADLNQPDARGRRVVEILSAGTSNIGGLRELFSLGLVSSRTAVETARARNARLVAEALEQAL